MEAVIQIFLMIILGVLACWCFNKLLWSWYKFTAARRARKHPEDFPRTGSMVFNKKTKQLEADSRPILPEEK